MNRMTYYMRKKGKCKTCGHTFTEHLVGTYPNGNKQITCHHSMKVFLEFANFVCACNTKELNQHNKEEFKEEYKKLGVLA